VAQLGAHLQQAVECSSFVARRGTRRLLCSGMRFGLLAICSGFFALLVTTSLLPAQDDPRADKLRRGLHDTELAGTWIYDDLEAGFAEADRTGKPLLIVFR